MHQRGCWIEPVVSGAGVFLFAVLLEWLAGAAFHLLSHDLRLFPASKKLPVNLQLHRQSAKYECFFFSTAGFSVPQLILSSTLPGVYHQYHQEAAVPACPTNYIYRLIRILFNGSVWVCRCLSPAHIRQRQQQSLTLTIFKSAIVLNMHVFGHMENMQPHRKAHYSPMPHAIPHTLYVL